MDKKTQNTSIRIWNKITIKVMQALLRERTYEYYMTTPAPDDRIGIRKKIEQNLRDYFGTPFHKRFISGILILETGEKYTLSHTYFSFNLKRFSLGRLDIGCAQGGYKCLITAKFCYSEKLAESEEAGKIREIITNEGFERIVITPKGLEKAVSLDELLRL